MHKEFWLELGRHGKKHSRVLRRAFRHFSKFGGYPVCHKDKGKRSDLLARQIVDTVVNRTVEHDPLGARIHPDRRLLRETFRRVCRYAGQSVRPRVIAQEIGEIFDVGVSEEKVAKSIEFFEDAMLLYQVLPLELLQKKHHHPPKLCLCDHFVRNAFLQEIIPIDPGELPDAGDPVATAAGHIIESVIGYYFMGIPGVEVSWFPKRAREAEVDFVLTVGDRRIPIEVKYRRRPASAERLEGVRGFCEKAHYDAPFGLVITQDECGAIDERIIAVPASTLLLLT